MKTIHRRYLILCSVFLLVMGLILGITYFRSQHRRSLVIGAKNCTEGQVVSEVIAQLVEDRLGISVSRKYGLDGTFVCFHALKANDIDLYVEYTGSAYTGILKKSPVGVSREKMLSELRHHFLSEYKMRWMEPLGFENNYVLLVKPSFSEQYGVKTISDLKNLIEDGKEVRIGFDPEFYGRPEGGMIQNVYQIPVRGLKLMDHSLLYMTLFREALEVINGYSTDGYAMGYVFLKDDKKCFPFYDAFPLVYDETLDKFPQLEGILSLLNRKISSQEVAQMNYAVENKGESVYTVAKTFLKNHQLIHDSSRIDH